MRIRILILLLCLTSCVSQTHELPNVLPFVTNVKYKKGQIFHIKDKTIEILELTNAYLVGMVGSKATFYMFEDEVDEAMSIEESRQHN